MPSLSITPKYDPGPEIGIATPMRTTRSCAVAAADARTMAPASASLVAKFMTPPPMGCGECTTVAASRMSYLVGIDIGGTFTDCAIVDRAGKLLTTKVPSTPPDFARGMMDALGAGADALGISLDEFCRDIAFLSHGTTVGTNTIIQKRGAKVGLITTKGHEDAIHIMRGSRGYGGRDIRKVVHFPETAKPAPIVPKRLIRGISERVDCFGEVVVRLNEEEAEAAIRDLVAQGVEAIAICFLWSFRNPKHENQVKAMVQQLAPELFVTTSFDIAPKWGEYERVTATALNAYLGPIMGGYLQRLDGSLRSLGYQHGLQITQCGGGTVPVARAGEAPLLTLDSGPVSGVTASMFLGAAMGERNVITTDMGGTSFDVSIIYEGKPAYSFISNTDQYEYFLPKVDLQAIGAGGGSLVRVKPETRTMTVGPDSAGAFPGPVCYGRGGEVPTVTDAQLVLGYLDPDNFAGGRMQLNKKTAEDAIGNLAQQIGMTAIECAAGACRIVELHMADIIRKVTAEEGIGEERQRFQFSLDVRHKGQINEVELILPWTRLPAGYEPALREHFIERYEQLYGRGSALRGAQLEIVVCRLRARALTPQPKLTRTKRLSRSIPRKAIRKKREIYWPDAGKHRASTVYDGELLAPGNKIAGPAIVETADTSVVVHPGTRLVVDALGNFEITFR